MTSVSKYFVARLLLCVCTEMFLIGNYKLRFEDGSVRSGIAAEETCFQLYLGFLRIAQKAINKTVCFFYKT